MQGVAGEAEACLEARGPAGCDKVEVTGFIESVDLVSDNRVTKICQVNANLVHATGLGGGIPLGRSAFPSSK